MLRYHHRQTLENFKNTQTFKTPNDVRALMGETYENEIDIRGDQEGVPLQVKINVMKDGKKAPDSTFVGVYSPNAMGVFGEENNRWLRGRFDTPQFEFITIIPGKMNGEAPFIGIVVGDISLIEIIGDYDDDMAGYDFTRLYVPDAILSEAWKDDRYAQNENVRIRTKNDKYYNSQNVVSIKGDRKNGYLAEYTIHLPMIEKVQQNE